MLNKINIVLKQQITQFKKIFWHSACICPNDMFKYTHRSKKQHRRPAVSLSNSMRETRETHQAGVKNHLNARIKR